MIDREFEIPIVHGTLSVRSPRAVLLLHPFQLPHVIFLFGLSIVFTIAPETLNHTPIAFETRGVIHHIWHYTLLVGSLLATVGMFVAHRRRLQLELSGLCLLTGALAMNLTAIVAQAVTTPDDLPSGLGMILRLGVITGFLVRIYILARQPTVQVPAQIPIQATEGA